MQVDQRILLAQELARAMFQFWRVGKHRKSFGGVKQSEFMLVVTLIHGTDWGTTGIRVSDLSARLGITSPGITHMLNSLEQAGYVERQSDKSDRRIVLVKPTAKGIDLFRQAKEEHNQQLQGLVEFLGEKDSKELVRLLSLAATYATEIWNSEDAKSEGCPTTLVEGNEKPE